GKKHIDERKIVAVGNADTRFQEDALRMMRGIRFASQLGFLIDDETRNAM
ncbi:CCA tRNA nucleotidyltransferase, partial [Candidatus Roizmanbacteria bacterium CG17_big_fil_post_rev_8_21_14_2_50_39_7]